MEIPHKAMRLIKAGLAPEARPFFLATKTPTKNATITSGPCRKKPWGAKVSQSSNLATAASKNPPEASAWFRPPRPAVSAGRVFPLLARNASPAVTNSASRVNKMAEKM